MLLPAALEELHVRRVIVPPHPGLFSALGLLATDLVYYDSRSAYVMLTPEQRAADRRACSRQMERRLRAGRASTPATAAFAAASTAACSARAGRRRSSRFPQGPITAQTIDALIERFHDAYERRYGNRFP